MQEIKLFKKITISLVEKDRVWSDNALKYGLSMGIRLDTLWPNAVKGFFKIDKAYEQLILGFAGVDV